MQSQFKKTSVKKKKDEIASYIEKGNYIEAANEMEGIFTNLSSTVSHVIERVASAKPITMKNGFWASTCICFPVRYI